jgi:hypothetical protein
MKANNMFFCNPYLLKEMNPELFNEFLAWSFPSDEDLDYFNK